MLVRQTLVSNLKPLESLKGQGSRRTSTSSFLDLLCVLTATKTTRRVFGGARAEVWRLIFVTHLVLITNLHAPLLRSESLDPHFP